MKTITSLKNPAVQEARALDSAKGRAKANAFLLDGEHMVGEGLQVCPQRVKTVFVDEKRAESFASLLAQAQGDVYAVPKHVLAAISQVKTPQGIAAVCELPQSRPLEAVGRSSFCWKTCRTPAMSERCCARWMRLGLTAASSRPAVRIPSAPKPFAPPWAAFSAYPCAPCRTPCRQ